MVYYGLVSLVPLLLLLLSGLGLMLRHSGFANAAEQQVLNIIEEHIGADLSVAISQMADSLRQASIVATVVSLIGLLITSSMLFRNLRLSFRAMWKYEPPPTLADTAAWILALPSPLVVVTVTFAFLFKFLPPVSLKWRHVLLPAVLCAVAWYIATEVIALYGLFFGSDVNAYGALGGLLVFMIWMNVVSQVLFFGAELCKVLAWSDASIALPDSDLARRL